MAIMNRQQVKELLPIIQAFAEGKTIQAYNPLTKEWYDKYESIDFIRNHQNIVSNQSQSTVHLKMQTNVLKK